MNNNRDNYFFMEQVGPKNMIFTQKGQKTGKKTGKHDQRPKNMKNRKSMPCPDSVLEQYQSK